MKNTIRDLIDSKAIYVDAQVSNMNKTIVSPNQNFQIYTNHLPSQSMNFINQPSSYDHHINYDEKIEEVNHVVNHFEL